MEYAIFSTSKLLILIKINACDIDVAQTKVFIFEIYQMPDDKTHLKKSDPSIVPKNKGMADRSDVTQETVTENLLINRKERNRKKKKNRPLQKAGFSYD